MRLAKVISGGQTGVDQAALDVAIEKGLLHGGWCPRGRRCEAGTIPQKYRLSPTESVEYDVRTERNVIASDGTLVLHWGPLSGGTAWTVECLEKHGKPFFLVDLQRSDDRAKFELVRHWLRQQRIAVLNVAGPRASCHSDIGRLAGDFLRQLWDPPVAVPSATKTSSTQP
ncbi:MAG: putative molybdenum carrier protein [Planctomycetota bacterium]|nr:putative molybdenum carrier protein [Planctomycetota bacterium]